MPAVPRLSMWPFRHVTKAAQADMIGLLRSLHTSFYFPFKDRSNIRFDLKQSL